MAWKHLCICCLYKNMTKTIDLYAYPDVDDSLKVIRWLQIGFNGKIAIQLWDEGVDQGYMHLS